MQKELDLICICCPKGCHLNLTVDESNLLTEVNGHWCKEGKEFAEREYRNPVRVLTATILTEAQKRRTLPVRTNKPIHKGKLLEAMSILAEVRIKPPVKMGQTIVLNILNTGADVIATDELPA